MQQVDQSVFVKIQQKGLMTIPKAFRDELGLKKNNIIKVIKKKDKLIIEPMKELSYKVRSYTPKEIQEFIEYDAELTKQLKKKKLL